MHDRQVTTTLAARLFDLELDRIFVGALIGYRRRGIGDQVNQSSSD